MGNFNDRGNGGGFRGGRGGGKPNFNKGGFGGGRGGDRGGRRDDRGPVSMHKAVCNECHKDCEVPFRPSSDKPIYCDNCFKGKRGNEAPRRDFGGDRGSRGDRRDFGGKPNFQRPQGGESNDALNKQMMEMNSKLDRLIYAIEKLTDSKPANSNFEVVAPKVEKKSKMKNPAVTKSTAKKIATKKPVSKKK